MRASSRWACSATALLTALTTACGGTKDGAQDGASGDTAGAAIGSASAGAEADPTRAAAGGAGVPAGYVGRADREGDTLTGARYTPRDGGLWEVQTGPAHIVWSAKDTATGPFTVRTRVAQLEAPSHPEAFGLFVGGRDLEGAGQRYTYFVVRGTGEYLVRVREGGATRDVRGWTAAPAITRQDASGRGTYELAVRAAADSVRFLVGGTPVHTVAAGAVPTDGLAGLRINHNLRLEVRPVVVERQRRGG
jgi:hypothetical protein